jgi:DNA (cytosine-5)-methyltransferase 1
MLKVIEAFSGIGSQYQAMKNIGCETEIAATIEWDMNAVYAYDIIHNGKQPNEIHFPDLNKKELVEKLVSLGISADGKEPANETGLRSISEDSLRKILYAIDRTHNLVDITKISASDLPNKIDILTYSFPCQDLSICGSWHGNMTGIDRTVKNRSGMLWEIERILLEFVQIKKTLPKFLLMENVSNILSRVHKENFLEWQRTLEEMGYYNQVYTLNAINFGIPQQRIRTFMLSVYCNSKKKRTLLKDYFESNNLEEKKVSFLPKLHNFLRTDYTNEIYRQEADISNPNFTESRQKIYNDNDLIFNGKTTGFKSIKTITTKQDRNPNSGLISYESTSENKAPYRNLTPRECFLFMGFNEDAYDRLMENNIFLRKGRRIFSREKTIKLAGNSIVVPVLEEIFRQILYIKHEILRGPRNEK